MRRKLETFPMKFCYVVYDLETMQKNYKWTGPYDIPARSLDEANDILFWTMCRLVQRDVDGGEFFESRILKSLDETTEGEWDQPAIYWPDVQEAIEWVILERRLKAKYPQGVPRHRSIDDDD